MAQRREFPFSDDRIEALPVPRARRTEYADTVCHGLRLRVGSSGTRSFCYWRQGDVGAGGKRDRVFEVIGRWSGSGLGGTFNVVSARARFLDLRGRESGRGGETLTVGELLDAFVQRGQTSDYAAAILRKHLDPLRHLTAATLSPAVLSDLVAKVQNGYEDDGGRPVGGPAVADKVRGGLRSLFAWAQRQGRFPQDRALPTLGLVREDFAEIGWKPRERVPSERELHALFDALGIGVGERLEIDLTQTPRVSVAARLAALLIVHVPVRSGVGVLSQPASAADVDARVLRWRTRKGGREATIETPLSEVAVAIVRELRRLEGGEAWLVPSPEDPRRPIDLKALARMFTRLQSPGRNGEPARVPCDEGREPFTPHALRGLWVTIAGDLGIDDGVTVRVIGHQPAGASKAQRYYDRSLRLDAQREAVERVSAELERIRRRRPSAPSPIVPLGAVGT
jgi:hypothetical protein